MKVQVRKHRNRIREILKYSLLFLVFLLFSCSDDDFFSQERLVATQITNPLNSTRKLDEVVNGTYWIMIGSQENGWTNPYDNYKTWNELGSDAYTITNPVHPLYNQLEGSEPWFSRSRDHFQTIGYPDDMAVATTWQGCYSNISNVNLVIQLVEEALPNVPFEDDDVNELPRIVGEAYFLRGYHHWIVNQLYGKAYSHAGNNTEGSIILKKRNSQGLDDTNIGSK